MEKSSPTALARHQLAAAKVPSGRRAHTVYGGHEHTLQQTVMDLTASRSLDDYENPGEAAVQVPLGRVPLVAGDTGWDGTPGDLLAVPDHRHSVEAVEDSAVLLTVASVVAAPTGVRT